MQLILPESVDFVIQNLLFPFEPLPKVVYLTFCIVVRPLEHFQVPSGLLQELSLILAPGSLFQFKLPPPRQGKRDRPDVFYRRFFESLDFLNGRRTVSITASSYRNSVRGGGP